MTAGELCELCETLRAALGDWRRRAGERPLVAVRIALIGSDVPPWVPSVAWADGFGGFDVDGADGDDARYRWRDPVFREAPAFDPARLEALSDEARADGDDDDDDDDDDDPADDPAFDARIAEAIAATEDDLRQALARLGPALTEAGIARIVLSPGHDRGHRTVWRAA